MNEEKHISCSISSYADDNHKCSYWVIICKMITNFQRKNTFKKT